jgi:hypothetical protein
MLRTPALLLLAVALAVPAWAGSPPPARSHIAASRHVATKHAPAARTVTHARGARDTTRTLEAIHIEGELDVPEVLFITARDQRRIVEFQHRRYLRTSTELLRETTIPPRVVVARGAAASAPAAAPPAATGGPR